MEINYNPKKARYEFGSYKKDGTLINIYRTDSLDGIDVLIGQAQGYAEYLGIETILKSCQKEILDIYKEINQL